VHVSLQARIPSEVEASYRLRSPDSRVLKGEFEPPGGSNPSEIRTRQRLTVSKVIPIVDTTPSFETDSFSWSPPFDCRTHISNRPWTALAICIQSKPNVTREVSDRRADFLIWDPTLGSDSLAH
jgi:hypothetical protein